MRLATLKGEPVEKLWKRKTNAIPQWALRREYRSTYRDTLADGEEIVTGTWPAKAVGGEVAPVSIEEGIADDLKLKLGDEVVFDVQGVRLNARVAAVRRVDWKRLQPNFFFVFAPGALEGAPGFHIFTTRTGSPEVSANLQRRLATEFPNVSVVDLNLLLQTLDSILSKVSFVIRFMGMFTVFAGLLVLAGALLTGRFQRIREVVLLRTLGASRKQIREIIFVEYAMLGFMAALSGVILAEAASAGLCIYLFKTSYLPAVWPALIGLFSVAVLTVVIGMFTNRGLLSQPPLQVLRSGLAD
jgi:putative ABC transport system permease protein